MLGKYGAELILPAEKNVVSYPKTNRFKGQIILTSSRILMQNSKNKISIMLSDITSIEKAPKGWCPGEESRSFSIDFTNRGDRYKVVAFVGPLSRDKIVERLKREVIGTCQIYFKYPAVQGGVMDNSSNWQKGKLLLTDKKAVVRSDKEDLILPYETIIDYGRNLFVGETRGMPTITVMFQKKDEEEGIVFIGESHNMSILEDYLKDITEKITMDLDLDESLNQLILVLDTGVTSESDISQIMGLDIKEVEALFDRLINMKLVRLVRIRREVELTRPTLRYINLKVKQGFG